MQEKSRVEQIIIENNIDIAVIRNKERKIKFIEDVYSNSVEKTLIAIVRKFKQYGTLEEKFNKDLIEFSLQEFIVLFETFPWTYSSFIGNKSIIKSYLDWARDNSLISNQICRTFESIDYNKPSHRKMYEKYYFKDFQELQYTIEQYRQKCKAQSSKLKFRLVEIIMHLAWTGIEMKDVVQLKINDIDRERRLIYVNRTNRYLSVEKIILDNLFDYFLLKEYNSEDYVGTDYVIRTAEISKFESSSYLSSLISRFIGDNEYNADDNLKSMTYQKVYFSGIFYRARLNEIAYGKIDRKDIERINEVFLENFTEYDPATAVAISKKFIDYTDYLKYMYREEYYRK